MNERYSPKIFYSPDKFANATVGDLSPEERKKAEVYLALKEASGEKLREIEKQLNAGEITIVRAALISLLHELSPSNLNQSRELAKLEPEFQYLEHKYASTKAGQLELARDEAEALNREYERLANNIDDANLQFKTFVTALDEGRIEHFPGGWRIKEV